ncbi:stationary phase survival protein SurE [Pedobacter frigiditerrae]|nr:stationary phase survival protein SurE [Pedobacter frigiditerrae]
MEKIKAIKNTVWSGVGIGAVVPLFPGALVWFLMQKVVVLKKADLLLIGCIALNAFLMNYFFKQNKDNVARGIISITFLWAFAFFFYKVL